MRHFTEAATPVIAKADQKDMFDDLPGIMYRAFTASHEQAEIEFSNRFGREPDYPYPIDVDTCWRLFLAELDVRSENAWEYGEGDEGAEEHRLLNDLVEHYRQAHQKARRDYIATFLTEAGLTQKAFASTLGHTENQVSTWRKGWSCDEDAVVPDWLIVWCTLWQEAPEELRRRITEQTTADQWLPEHDPLPRSWVGRWSELLLALPPDRQPDMLHHIRMIVD